MNKNINTSETPSIANNPLVIDAVRMFKAAGCREIYLFGSAAKGDIDSANDLDFAVSGLAPEKFIAVLSEVNRVMPKPVDLIDLDSDNAFTRYLRDENELVRIG
jgi:predicted nucleotidyltransferase